MLQQTNPITTQEIPNLDTPFRAPGDYDGEVIELYNGENDQFEVPNLELEEEADMTKKVMRLPRLTAPEIAAVSEEELAERFRS